MSYGTNVIIPSGASVQKLVPSGMQFPTLAILNPNDGTVYVSANVTTTSNAPGAWDWKIPSQSYCLLPGTPNWGSVSMYYLDQSGTGRGGEITFFPVNKTTDIPVFQAIGRALLAQETNLDVVEGILPANPGSGIARLWIDTSDDLHILNASGQDVSWIDTETYLGGVLQGFFPNADLVDLAVVTAKINDAAVTAAKIAAGAASSNIGALGGVLSGSLPNPGFVANPVFSGNIQVAGRVLGPSTPSGFLIIGDCATIYLEVSPSGGSVIVNNGPFVVQNAVATMGAGLTVVGPLTLPIGSVSKTMLANESKVRLLGQYSAAVSFSSSTINTWIATPMTVTVTSLGGPIEICYTVAAPYATSAGANIYTALFRGAGLLVNPSFTNGVIANQAYPVSLASFVDVVGAGTYTYTVYMNASSAFGYYNNTNILTVKELNS